MKIAEIRVLEILDSRGRPALEVVAHLEGNGRSVSARAAVPSGASTGRHEALELRDGDKKRYHGGGLLKACASVEGEIAEALAKINPLDQRRIDETMIQLDGTPNKSRLGANAILGVSLALAKAAAKSAEKPLFCHLAGDGVSLLLPRPMMNVLNGGAHADNALDIQEFMIVPAGASSFREACRIGAEVFHALKDRLRKAGHSVNVGDEGGFAPDLRSSREALDFLMEAISAAGYRAGKQVFLALDVAASEILTPETRYHLKGEDAILTAEEMTDTLASLVQDYPILSIEDGLAEDDWAGWRHMTASLGEKTMLVGDDLFATNMARLKRGIKEQCATAILIKPNQIGTLTETLDVVSHARNCGFACVISHRSGDTEDTTIADLAVALGTGWIKTGGLSRSERTAKYNRLMRIEKMLGNDARYAGLEGIPR